MSNVKKLMLLLLWGIVSLAGIYYLKTKKIDMHFVLIIVTLDRIFKILLDWRFMLLLIARL
jgi:hypothetical protein